jgi:poly-beta-1,6-N-acetyl-D-glucosamine synthase
VIFSPTDIILGVVYLLVLYLTIFWLLVLFDKDEVARKRLTRFPLVSIIIPAFNEELTIEKALRSVLEIDYPKIQIIVVNDGSTDRTIKVVESTINELGGFSKFNIKLVNQINKGKGAALNHALKYAKGKFYATLDADSTVDKKILKNLLPYFTTNEIAAVLPLLKIKNPSNIMQRIQRYEYIINMFYKKLNAKLDCVHVTPGPFSVYRTDIVRKIGCYDENNITEDLEIAIRLQKYHYKIVQTAEPAVYTMPPDNLKDLYHQRNRWYKGSVLNSFRYKSIMFNKKYGDFGFIRLPTIALSGALAIIILGTLAFDVAHLLTEKISNLALIQFDILTLIKTWSLSFHVLDINFIKLSVVLFMILLSFGVMIYSFRHSKEKITKYGKTFFSLTTYMMLYSFFLSIVWLMIGVDILRRKTQKW